MTQQSADFLVRRDDLTITDVVDAPGPDDIALADGEVLLAVDAFSFTANNITYATLGEAFSYWDFFPAPEGWGRVPVWGFADVVRSEHPDVAVGERFYGYLPMSTHLVVSPTRVDGSGFVDGVAHRQERAAVYNRYANSATDPGYDQAVEAEQMLLRPLFGTAFLIDDLLADNEYFGAQTVVLSSASSKTAYATAFLLALRGDVQLVGLTSPGNVEFVERLGCYDTVLTYDTLEDLPPDEPTLYVDMSGNGAVRGDVHRHLGDALRYDCMVGMTHHDALGMEPDLPGATPILFFAPDQAKKRAADWGPAGLEQRLAAAWAPYLERVTDPERRLLNVRLGAGPDAVEAVYREALAGRTAPDEGHILTMRG
jgi:Protein of unknown function (DUF2855)